MPDLANYQLNMQTNDLYYHPHLMEQVQVTATAGKWVEFLVKHRNELRWLEQPVFEFAFKYVDKGDPIVADLDSMRQHAKDLGILIPKEFNYS